MNAATESSPISLLFGEASPPARTLRLDTKRIGDLSELHVALALAKNGFHVAKPFGENARYDLVADDGERMYRVQVKTGRLRNGVVAYSACSSHAHRNGPPRPYFGEIDYLAVFCPQNRKVYLLPESELVASQGHLRLVPAKNNMKRGIRWAHGFELP